MKTAYLWEIGQVDLYSPVSVFYLMLGRQVRITFMKYKSKGENGDVHPTNTMDKHISVATEDTTAKKETFWSNVAFGRDPMIVDWIVIETKEDDANKHKYL